MGIQLSKITMHISLITNLKDNIFSDCLYDVYNETGWRKFIESIKEHIIKSFEGINLSGNNNLIDYLDEVGSVTIVQRKKSPKSNEAFCRSS